MYKTKIGNVLIHFQRLGKGEPLIFLHGLGEMKEGWSHQHELADQFELIIPDLRGHGESKETNDISIPNFAKDVLLLLDSLGIESAHICGLSMGGAVAQEIYRQAPKRCRSLILVSTFHYAPKFLGTWFYAYRKIRAKFLSPEQQREVIARNCLYSWNDEVKQRFIKSYRPNNESFFKSMKAALEIDNRKLLRRVSVPTLIIGCQYDTVTPIWFQIDMHKKIPNSELVIFRNTGHIAKLESKQKFNETIRAFIHKHRKKAS